MTSKIQLLFDGEIRGYKTGYDCVKFLCSKRNFTQAVWTGFEKLSEQELSDLLDSDHRDDTIDEIITSAECKLNGERFTLHWHEGSIFAVEDSAIEQFNTEYI